jgi:hypothetical protein
VTQTRQLQAGQQRHYLKTLPTVRELSNLPMSALGQKRTFRSDRSMSAIPPKADTCACAFMCLARATPNRAAPTYFAYWQRFGYLRLSIDAPISPQKRAPSSFSAQGSYTVASNRLPGRQGVRDRGMGMPRRPAYRIHRRPAPPAVAS